MTWATWVLCGLFVVGGVARYLTLGTDREHRVLQAEKAVILPYAGALIVVALFSNSAPAPFLGFVMVFLTTVHFVVINGKRRRITR